MFFLCTCFGGFKVQGAEAAAVHNNSPPCSLALETLPAAVTGEVFEEPLDLVEDEDDSVDHARREQEEGGRISKKGS